MARRGGGESHPLNGTKSVQGLFMAFYCLTWALFHKYIYIYIYIYINKYIYICIYIT